MATTDPITVGYDGSDDARRAASWAGAIAAARGDAAVHLVHALTLPSIPAHHWQMRVESVLERQESEIRAELESERSRLEALGVPTELFVRRWLPIETLLEHARDHGSGLIVIGRHGHRPTHLLIGSVSEAIARQAAVPVVVVRGRDSASAPRTVLLAIDGSEAAQRAAQAIASWFPGAHVRAVWIREDERTPDLEEMKAQLTRAGIAPDRIELRVDRGPAAETLLRLADEPEVDLLAAGRRGRSTWRRLLVGGVCDKLLQLAPCPVLVAH